MNEEFADALEAPQLTSVAFAALCEIRRPNVFALCGRWVKARFVIQGTMSTLGVDTH